MNADSPTVPPVIAPPPPAVPSARPPRFKFLLAAAIWMIVVVTGVLVTWMLPEMFVSATQVVVQPDASEVFNPTNATGSVPDYDPIFLQTQMHVITSEAVLTRVVDELDLISVWGKKYSTGHKLKASECVALLKARLDVRRVRNTKIITIRVYSGSPQESATLANSVVQAYQIWRTDYLSRHIPNAGSALQSSVEVLEKAIPAVKPIRPNIPLNVAVSMVMGAMFGILLALLVYLLQWRAYRRKIGVYGAIPSPGLRNSVRIIIGLMVGVVVGYNCAMPIVGPMDLALFPMVLMVGGIGLSSVELISFTPMPSNVPATTESQTAIFQSKY